MTTVELVSNPEVGVSTHSWTVHGVPQLTRENKISSLPFWVPNDRMKKHQFRLVLLKGLAPAAKEVEDAYGVVLELVPPPTDPTGAEAPASRYPGGCSVEVRVVSHARSSAADISSTQTALLDESNTQVSFPDALPAAAARSPAFLVGEPPALTITVTICTGVNVFAQQIASSVTSLWSTLTTSVSKLVDTTVRVYHEGRKEFEAAGKGPTPAAAPATTYPDPPWAHAPTKWSSRADEWRALVRDRAVEDDGFFLFGPERGVTEDERQLLLKAGFNYRELAELYPLFDYDRDVHEGLLASDAIRQQRYHLVPARLREGLFWATYFWKVACLATCDDDAQVRTLLTVLNAPPASAPRRPDPAVSGSTEEEVMTAAAEAQEAADLLLEYLSDSNGEDDAFLMETAASTCEDHVKRLEPQFRRTDLSESTLLVVGTTLRRLRERVARHHDLVRARRAAKEEATAAAMAPAVAGSTGATAGSPPRAADVSAGQAGSPAAPPPGAGSPEPHTPPAPAPTTQLGGAEPPRARTGSSSGPAVAFPKMPWEEEDEEESTK